jgi:hypothetical protein
MHRLDSMALGERLAKELPELVDRRALPDFEAARSRLPHGSPAFIGIRRSRSRCDGGGDLAHDEAGTRDVKRVEVLLGGCDVIRMRHRLVHQPLHALAAPRGRHGLECRDRAHRREVGLRQQPAEGEAAMRDDLVSVPRRRDHGNRALLQEHEPGCVREAVLVVVHVRALEHEVPCTGAAHDLVPGLERLRLVALDSEIRTHRSSAIATPKPVAP